MSGEKTLVYWIGLILLSAALLALFQIFWMFAFVIPQSVRNIYRSPLVPVIVGGIVFAVIGIYMMREGVSETHRGK